MSDYDDGYAEGRATYIDKLDELTMQQEVDRKHIAELERDGMEPRAVLRSRIAELEANLIQERKDKNAWLIKYQSKVSELEAEVAKAMAMLRLVGAETDKNMFDKIEADNACLRECLKRIEEIVQDKIIYLWAMEIAKITREGLK